MSQPLTDSAIGRPRQLRDAGVDRAGAAPAESGTLFRPQALHAQMSGNLDNLQ